ncbi:hypothetical protein FHG87_005473 [Trinorchestia longiramus]|nr:hypothetical protein FHG87_005473 [Trinorchestia longiramus]
MCIQRYEESCISKQKLTNSKASRILERIFTRQHFGNNSSSSNCKNSNGSNCNSSRNYSSSKCSSSSSSSSNCNSQRNSSS